MILLVVALGSAGAALVVRHDTGDVAGPGRAGARTGARTRSHRAGRRTSDSGGSAPERGATNAALAALFAAEQAQVDASNHAVDVANQAVDQYNNAQTTDLVAAFQGAGDAALADLEAKTAAVRAAAEAAQRAVASLQGALG